MYSHETFLYGIVRLHTVDCFIFVDISATWSACILLSSKNAKEHITKNGDPFLSKRDAIILHHSILNFSSFRLCDNQYEDPKQCKS